MPFIREHGEDPFPELRSPSQRRRARMRENREIAINTGQVQKKRERDARARAGIYDPKSESED